MAKQHEEPCDCEEGYRWSTGVPGILARIEGGSIVAGTTVERCDLCERFASDDDARSFLEAWLSSPNQKYLLALRACGSLGVF